MLEFRFPHTNIELKEWSEAMHNCLYGYENVILQKVRVIVGVFIGKILMYVLEIYDGEICQAYGKFNSTIEEKVLKKIHQWIEISKKEEFYEESIFR